MKYGLFCWTQLGWKFLHTIDPRSVNMAIRLCLFEWAVKREWLHCVKLLGV